jgi:acetyl/propionyl-CoA carboxylase alpha subunit
VLDHPAFRAGEVHTGFIDQHLEALTQRPLPSPSVIAAAALAVPEGRAGQSDSAPAVRRHDPWGSLQGWGR